MTLNNPAGIKLMMQTNNDCVTNNKTNEIRFVLERLKASSEIYIYTF